MLGGHQRTADVITRPIQRAEGLLGVVPLVEDQGQLLAGPGQLLVAPSQFLGDLLEDGGVGNIARVDLVEQGDMEVGADQHPQVDLAPVAAFLFVVPPGGQGGRFGGVDILPGEVGSGPPETGSQQTWRSRSRPV